MTPDLRGLGVALATPFQPDGHLDLVGLRRLFRHVVDGGADFVVALGSTGEAATLEEQERDSVIAACRAEADGLPLVVGTGAMATRQAAAWTRRAQQLGADAALVVVPPYVRPTQAGIVAHFRAIASAVPELPLIAYNVPTRTGTNLLPTTLRELWEIPQVVAVKESSGDARQIETISKALPPGRLLLAGDDAMAVATIAAGGHGLISVVGNLLPQATKAMVAAALRGRRTEADALQARLQPVLAALAMEPNPIPLKAGLPLLALASSTVRLPLLPAESATRERLRVALADATAGPVAGSRGLGAAESMS